MKEDFTSQLNSMMGLPLGDLGRSSNLVWFSFGRSKIVQSLMGLEKRVAEFSLHVQCSWRITGRNQSIIAESKDIYQPSSKYHGSDDEFFWDARNEPVRRET